MRRLATACRNRDGFTLVEVTVAMTLLAMAFSSLAVVFVASLEAVAVSRERQAATELGNRTMEQLRALPYATATGGARLSDLAADRVDPRQDPRNVFLGSDGLYHLFSPTGEVIPAGSTAPLPAPLQPAPDTVEVDGADFLVRTYVSQATEAGVALYRATVIVMWAARASGDPKRFVTQSLLASPTGCVSEQTHPFAAPCDPFLYADAGTGGGALHVLPRELAADEIGDPERAIPGLDLIGATLSLADASSSLQSEQITAVRGQVRSSTATLDLDDAARQTAGGGGASTFVDSDPSTTPVPSDSQTLTHSPGDLFAGSPDRAYVRVVTGSGDAGTTTSTIGEITTPCRRADGTFENSGNSCGDGTAVQGAGSGQWLGGLQLGPPSSPDQEIALATIAAPAAESRVFTSRSMTTGATCSTSVPAVGCSGAQVERYTGTLTVGALPDSLVSRLPGWGSASGNWLFKVDGVRDQLRSQSGPGADAATAVRTAASGASAPPQLVYFDSSTSSYVSRNLDEVGPVPIPPVTVTDPLHPGGPLTIRMEPQVSIGELDTARDDTDCEPSCQTVAEAESPLVGSVHYTILREDEVVVRVSLEIDFGTARAATSYQQAPHAG
ncbi:prepilin-type N-terminal cleavage/methylation domain-containing protein [Kineosporiaceae bacterium SCSIO 59966]|nr:prepilin-type N-terminal cleavage/methylation domain-containing protein [Kineosporiaceae bacterium SCSIO 59966]